MRKAACFALSETRYADHNLPTLLLLLFTKAIAWKEERDAEKYIFVCCRRLGVELGEEREKHFKERRAEQKSRGKSVAAGDCQGRARATNKCVGSGFRGA